MTRSLIVTIPDDLPPKVEVAILSICARLGMTVSPLATMETLERGES